MVRIKGANSDYVYVGDPAQPIEERKDADPLFLKIFICPYDMPSSVEPNDGEVCEGTDVDCPYQEESEEEAGEVDAKATDDPEAKEDGPKVPRPGHALISLHQHEGVSLVADQGNRLRVDNQSGNIQLSPALTGQVVVQGAFVIAAPSEAEVTSSPAEDAEDVDAETSEAESEDALGREAAEAEQEDAPEPPQKPVFVVLPEGTTIEGVEGALVLTQGSEGQPMVLEVVDPQMALVLKAQGTQLEMCDRTLSLQANGAKVVIGPDGNIELTPASTGKVKINGDLDVTGEVTVAGKPLPPPS